MLLAGNANTFFKMEIFSVETISAFSIFLFSSATLALVSPSQVLGAFFQEKDYSLSLTQREREREKMMRAGATEKGRN